ncbi:glucose-6-phosphate isomerase [Gallaecimonas xiamenensis]|uniref:Glucose-6-phosphate isomerase n=1 Tax=Gallaecimonas xiamenensis 3-C-1 TaxID=745411 RepID=K2KC09_9GAMM|nr:glucose-6-phosphate isomerase [Gallaecimonas xiamenensis]EKE74895.1 glucose-6-phosphate isomerase [Gallaecimonas xiamenensis 3-C-1]
MTGLTRYPCNDALAQHLDDLPDLKTLFRQDPSRGERYSLDAAGLTLDYSKNHLNEQTLALFARLAEEAGLEGKIKAMFKGQPINHTEGRAVLHCALRGSVDSDVMVDGVKVSQEVSQTLAKMATFVDSLYQGRWLGFTGKAITDVVSIGIGGSFLGPKIVTEALKPFWQRKVAVHYVANIDGAALADKLAGLDPQTTLFITASKSFGTQETLSNSESARDWLKAAGASFEDLAKHFVAVTANVPKAEAFGIAAQNCFPMWDWVGGRYSLWSAIGLPIALAIGMANFEALLAGARDMDQHFVSAPISANMPALMALIGVSYINYQGASSHALLPYDHGLRALPGYVQQLDMESNGKGCHQDGSAISHLTGPVIWGAEGTNGQHAFHQLLHQGKQLIPADFILPLESHYKLGRHHAMLASNCFAQSQALMQGKTLAEAQGELRQAGLGEAEVAALAPHKVMPGNRPSNTLLMDKVTPQTLGALIALYEHKVLVQGLIWDLNSFDQWGVELGKVLGNAVLDKLEDQSQPLDLDSSTNGLIARFRQQQQKGGAL